MVVVLFLIEPQRYRATADVVIPVQPTTTGSRIAAVEQAVSDFEGALRSSIVAQRVAAATGVSVGEVEGNLVTEQLFGASVVEVSYAATNPNVAEQVVAAASRESLVVLQSAQLGPVEQLLNRARLTAQRVNDQYTDFRSTLQILDPQELFQSKDRRMIDLQDKVAGLISRGETAAAEEAQEQLDRLSTTWVPVIAEFEILEQARLRANQSRSEAEAAYATAAAGLDAARAGSSATVASALPIPRVPELARRLLTVVVLATGLAIAMIVLLELTARGKPAYVPSSMASKGPAPAPAAVAALTTEPASRAKTSPARTPEPGPQPRTASTQQPASLPRTPPGQAPAPVAAPTSEQPGSRPRSPAAPAPAPITRRPEPASTSKTGSAASASAVAPSPESAPSSKTGSAARSKKGRRKRTGGSGQPKAFQSDGADSSEAKHHERATAPPPAATSADSEKPAELASAELGPAAEEPAGPESAEPAAAAQEPAAERLSDAERKGASLPAVRSSGE